MPPDPNPPQSKRIRGSRQNRLVASLRTMDFVTAGGEPGRALRADGSSWGPGSVMPMLLQEELSLAASRAKTFRRALRIILRRLCGEFDWDFGEAWVPSRDGTVLKPGTVWPRSNPDYLPYREASRRLGFLPGHGLPGRAWVERRPIGIEDIAAESVTNFTRRDAALANDIHSALAIPLLAGREDVVAIVVLYRTGQPRLDQREVEVLRHLVAPLGPVVAQKRVEVELAARERQQKAVAHLGMAVLADEADLESLLGTAVRLTVATLGIGHCMLLEFLPEDEELHLRAGIGWKRSSHARIPAGPQTAGGLHTREPRADHRAGLRPRNALRAEPAAARARRRERPVGRRLRPRTPVRRALRARPPAPLVHTRRRSLPAIGREHHRHRHRPPPRVRGAERAPAAPRDARGAAHDAAREVARAATPRGATRFGGHARGGARARPRQHDSAHALPSRTRSPRATCPTPRRKTSMPCATPWTTCVS